MELRKFIQSTIRELLNEQKVLNEYITKEFNIKKPDAYNLPAGYIGKNESGWEISGEIHDDHYKWVTDFEAIHPIFGKVWGNFEDKVFADTEEGYNDFIENHPPVSGDYLDI